MVKKFDELTEENSDIAKKINEIIDDILDLRKSHIGLQESHIKIQTKVYGKELHETSKKIIEEDNWNLADNFDMVEDCPSGTYVVRKPNLKRFIQKVKEDLETTKKICPHCNAIDKPKCVQVLGIKEIIKKRAGDLK